MEIFSNQLFIIYFVWNLACSAAIMYHIDEKKIKPIPVLIIGILLGWPVAAAITLIKN